MKKIIIVFCYTTLLFGIWMLFTLDTSIFGIAIGAAASFLIAVFSYNRILEKNKIKLHRPRIILMIRYSIRLIYEIYRASFLQILRIVKQDNHSVIVKIKLDVSDPLIITLIANSITLTPGTITIDVKGRTLYVLSIKDDGEDGEQLKKSIKSSFQKFFMEKHSKTR